MVDAKQLGPARVRNDCTACFLEIGIVGRCPEDWRDWYSRAPLQGIGDGQRAERFRERVNGPAEQSRLLAGRYDYSLPTAGCLEPLFRFSGCIESRRYLREPFSGCLRPNSVEAITPCLRAGRKALVPIRRRVSSRDGGSQRIAAQCLGYDTWIHWRLAKRIVRGEYSLQFAPP